MLLCEITKKIDSIILKLNQKSIGISVTAFLEFYRKIRKRQFDCMVVLVLNQFVSFQLRVHCPLTHLYTRATYLLPYFLPSPSCARNETLPTHDNRRIVKTAAIVWMKAFRSEVLVPSVAPLLRVVVLHEQKCWRGLTLCTWTFPLVNPPITYTFCELIGFP